MGVFEYNDYKAYLRAFIASLPKKGRGEVNRIGTHLGTHPSLVSQVLNGANHFNLEQTHRLCGYLGLPPPETDYLVLLVQRERAGTADLRKYFQNKIDDVKKNALQISSRLKPHRQLTDYERSVFYSSWLYSAVRLFTSVSQGQSLEAVAQYFSLSRQHAGEILRFLVDAHLCEEENGGYRMGTQHTHIGFGSPFLTRHHSNWRIKAVQRSETLSEDELMFTSPFSISKEDFFRIREELVKLIKISSVMIKDSPAEDLACMNLDLFWVRR